MSISRTLKKYIGTVGDSLYDIFKQSTGIAALQVEGQPEVGARSAYRFDQPIPGEPVTFPLWIIGGLALLLMYGRKF